MAVTTRIYDDFTTAQAAMSNVNALGLPGVDVSLIGDECFRDYDQGVIQRDAVTGRVVTVNTEADASGTSTGAGIGAVIGGGGGLLAGLGLLAIPGVGPVVAAGWLAATAVGAIGGALAGGAVGAIVDLGLSEEDTPVFSEAIRRGGVAVSVRFPEEHRNAVVTALDNTPTRSLEDRRIGYEAEGWRSEETEEERLIRLRATRPIDPPIGF
ncbi:hypothetical protein [Cypionkella sinensis]|uniref:DUF1269 domain-containing protein n=1 Tax=Cypionkella sinensis TaxID=1756043 RepID=A0ABV7J2W4_9RHOB